MPAPCELSTTVRGPRIVFTLHGDAGWLGEAVLLLGRSVQLERVWLTRRARGCGHGRRLLKAVCRWLDTHRCSCRLYAMAYDHGPLKNNDLAAWYHRHGWRSIGHGDMRRPASKM